MKSEKIEVAAIWEDRIPYREKDGVKVPGTGVWTDYGDTEPVMCRASLSTKRLTVWLPSGKKVIIRRYNGTNGPFWYCWQDQFGDGRRIVFTLPK